MYIDGLPTDATNTPTITLINTDVGNDGTGSLVIQFDGRYVRAWMVDDPTAILDYDTNDEPLAVIGSFIGYDAQDAINDQHKVYGITVKG